MRRHLLVLLLIGVAAGFALRSEGHVPLWRSVQGNAVPAAWPSGLPVAYRRHVGIGPSQSNLEPGSLPVPAIDAGMAAAAQTSGLTFISQGTTTTSGPLLDGTNLVTFADTVPNQSLLMGGLLVTLTWYDTTTNQVTEFDVIGSGQAPLSTLSSAAFFDVQTLITHGAGHGLGLDHHSDFSATMFPTFFTGSLRGRDFNADEARGIRFLQGATDPLAGSITGILQRPSGAAAIAGHASLIDVITGRVASECVTDDQGRFTFEPVPPGVFHVYVQPLDGPTTPAALIAPYWPGLPTDNTFRTTALGPWTDPTEVVVHPGEAVSLGTIIVDGPPPTLDVDQVFFNTTPTPLTPGTASFLEAAAPVNAFAGIFGAGINGVADAGFDLTGPFVSITGPSTWSGPPGPVTDRIFPVALPPETPPGAYALRVRDAATGESVLFPGSLEVLPPPAPRAWSAAYGRAGLGSTTFNVLTASGSPSLGNAAFSLQVTGAVPGQLAYWLFSGGPESILIVPGQELGVDPARLVLPLASVAFPIATPTVTLPLPLPSDPALAGLDLFVQVLLVDPLASFGATLSNGLALHFE